MCVCVCVCVCVASGIPSDGGSLTILSVSANAITVEMALVHGNALEPDYYELEYQTLADRPSWITAECSGGQFPAPPGVSHLPASAWCAPCRCPTPVPRPLAPNPRLHWVLTSL